MEEYWKCQILSFISITLLAILTDFTLIVMPLVKTSQLKVMKQLKFPLNMNLLGAAFESVFVAVFARG